MSLVGKNQMVRIVDRRKILFFVIISFYRLIYYHKHNKAKCSIFNDFNIGFGSG